MQLFFQQNFDFIFFAFLHVISDFQQKHAKIIIAADFGTSGGYTDVKSISVSRNLVKWTKNKKINRNTWVNEWHQAMAYKQVWPMC